jgi:hypothetical protein
MREHNVAALTATELDAARRELAASLALARPGSPVRAPIQARMTPSTPNWPDGPPPGPGYPAPRVLSLRRAGTRVEEGRPGILGAGAFSRLGRRPYWHPRAGR